MGIDKDKDKDAVVGGFVRNCMDTKFIMGTILVMGLLLVMNQLMPLGEFGSNSCQKWAQSLLYSGEVATKEMAELKSVVDIEATNTTEGSANSGGEKVAEEEEDGSRVVLKTYGNAAYLFIQMGAYRGGENTFAVIGLASKPLHVFGKPRFECEWIPKNSTLGPVKGKAYKMLPDWGYGRVYTVVVVNCTFSEGVGSDGSGGELVVHAYHGGVGVEQPERIVALAEREFSYNATVFNGPPPYDYLYCGSPLYGDVSPQRMREWMAYHAKFFGPGSHFVLYDAGGVHSEVLKVLEPWIRAGRVTLQDIRDQEQYDGYYHNQFLVVNDCLHRYKFMANWTFFFDIDEYLYIPRGRTLHSVVDEFSNYTQFTIEQYTMSNKLCLHRNDPNQYSREWGLEKLVFRDVKRGIRRDRKYAVQARNVQATGVHMSENFAGQKQHQTTGKIRYYHYHDTISGRVEPCREFVNPSMKKNVTWFQGTPHIYDATLKHVCPSIKEFEQQQIGSVLASTPQ